ncbi:MAG: HPr family phosphocarrier protein [Lachnospiraceae bacterium]|nr:HPr family phosphocarrier protein [Lachnospiraceae bacterium]
MKELFYVINLPQGLHARPAAKLAEVASAAKSLVTVEKDDLQANAKSVLQILKINVKQHEKVTIRIEGEDEEEVAEKIDKILQSHPAEKLDGTKVFRIAFFGSKDYDRVYFSQLSHEKGDHTYNSHIHFFEPRLTEETVELAKGYDAVCIFVNDECNSKVIETLHEFDIHLILLRCAGFNNVDLKVAKEFNMTVLRVPAYSPYAVAEHAMAILQAANRRLHKAHNRVRDNDFELSGLVGLDLHNKVAGVLGTGKIGQCFARICKGYGMTVIGWDAYPNQSLVDEGLLTYSSLDDVISKADLISLHAPLIMGEGGTYHLIDRERVDKMKDDVMLINTARGALIDNEALLHGLRSKKFHAVALDVYEGEDQNVYVDRSSDVISNDITARLQFYPQVLLTSHQAFFTREALQAIATVTMENVLNYITGKDYGNALVEYKE